MPKTFSQFPGMNMLRQFWKPRGLRRKVASLSMAHTEPVSSPSLNELPVFLSLGSYNRLDLKNDRFSHADESQLHRFEPAVDHRQFTQAIEKYCDVLTVDCKHTHRRFDCTAIFPRPHYLGDKILVPLLEGLTLADTLKYDRQGNILLYAAEQTPLNRFRDIRFAIYDPELAVPEIDALIARNKTFFAGIPPELNIGLVEKELDLGHALNTVLRELRDKCRSDEDSIEQIQQAILTYAAYGTGLRTMLKVALAQGETLVEKIAHAGVGNCFDWAKVAYVIATKLGIPCEVLAGYAPPQEIDREETKLAAINASEGVYQRDNILIRPAQLSKGNITAPIREGTNHAVLRYFDRDLRYWKTVDMTPSIRKRFKPSVNLCVDDILLSGLGGRTSAAAIDMWDQVSQQREHISALWNGFRFRDYPDRQGIAPGWQAYFHNLHVLSRGKLKSHRSRRDVVNTSSYMYYGDLLYIGQSGTAPLLISAKNYHSRV